MTAQNGNGMGKVVWWLLQAVFAVALGIGGMLVNNLTAETTRLSFTQLSQGQQIAVLEESARNTAQRLVRIEQKVDTVVERSARWR